MDAHSLVGNVPVLLDFVKDGGQETSTILGKMLLSFAIDSLLDKLEDEACMFALAGAFFRVYALKGTGFIEDLIAEDTLSPVVKEIRMVQMLKAMPDTDPKRSSLLRMYLSTVTGCDCLKTACSF